MLLLYVDDMFLREEDECIEYAKRRLATDFKMKYVGMMHYFLGMEVWQSTDGIFLGQVKYAVEILKFDMVQQDGQLPDGPRIY